MGPHPGEEELALWRRKTSEGIQRDEERRAHQRVLLPLECEYSEGTTLRMGCRSSQLHEVTSSPPTHYCWVGELQAPEMDDRRSFEAGQ